MSRRLLVLVAAFALASCAVGPDFKSPAVPVDAGYTPEKLADTAATDVVGGGAQHFNSGEDIPGEWWSLFHSPALDALVKEALAHNPDLTAAQASLREAHENTLATEGNFFPTIGAEYTHTREKFSGAAFGQPNNHGFLSLNTGEVTVGYAPDVFGGTRRQVEASEAAETYQRFQLEAAYLTLTSNVVAAAVQEASLRAQIAATQDIVKAESDQLDLLNHQFQLGAVARSAVLQQTATLAQEKATLPPLQKQLAQQRDRIAALAGRFPNHPPDETFDLATLTLPQALPVSLPSRLVEQRPDVQAAEATLHQASAEIGVATANMLPQFNLTGDIGTEATTIGSMFAAGTGIWSIAAGVTQPLFHGGTLLHEKRAAEAAYDAAAAQYRSTVLSSFQNVADTLRALQSDADALQADTAAERSANESLSLARDQYRLGAVSLIELLNAETTYEQARIALVQAQAARYADTAALFEALGGGWWHRSDVAQTQTQD
ncbi:MAG TPA: efflux transporter outer membrane subunit [Stellaceae bacterium]|nr:efflux transporter outer membrane subunit [Stellaceae bacterium]HEV2265061.1 efflux transporter outer membrane subunit [Stellaceae bacterium]